MKDFSYITSSHPQFIENLYQDFVKNPESVDPELRKFFEGFDFAMASGKGTSNGGATTAAEGPTTALPSNIDWMREIRAYRMILGYRNKGHLIAKTNPIRKRKDRGPISDWIFMALRKPISIKPSRLEILLAWAPLRFGLFNNTWKNVMRPMWVLNSNTSATRKK